MKRRKFMATALTAGIASAATPAGSTGMTLSGSGAAGHQSGKKPRLMFYHDSRHPAPAQPRAQCSPGRAERKEHRSTTKAVSLPQGVHRRRGSRRKLKSPVLPDGHPRADILECFAVKLANDDTRPLVEFGQYSAPGIHDRAVSVGAPTLTILPPLGPCHQPNLIFNGTGTYQCMPVGVTGMPGKGTG